MMALASRASLIVTCVIICDTRRSAGTITDSSSSRAGPSTSSPTGPSAGPPQPGAATPPSPPAIPSSVRRALLADRRGSREVVAVVEVGKQAGVGRMPAEDSPGREGGRRVVQDDHRREEPEVRLQPAVRDAFGG